MASTAATAGSITGPVVPAADQMDPHTLPAPQPVPDDIDDSDEERDGG